MQRTVRLNAIAAATWLPSAVVLIPATQRGLARALSRVKAIFSDV